MSGKKEPDTARHPRPAPKGAPKGAPSNLHSASSVPDPVPAPAAGAGDDDFDALGFDTSFGLSPGMGTGGFDVPGSFGMDPGGLSDKDDTPPAGVVIGEDVQVLSAKTIGKALAEAEGKGDDDHALPDLTVLQKGLVGIDVGASAAVIARFNEDGQHEVVRNQDNERATAAQIVFDEDGEQLLGREARRMAPSAPARSVVDLKEMIADPFFRLQAGTAEELDSKTILKVVITRLLEDVERVDGERPTHVALAAPAWFGEPQREVLRLAAEATGVTLVGITDETLAAAVPYSLRLADLRPRVALVFDMGHAALGVGLVRCAGGDITVLGQEARRDLGSARWDLLLAEEAGRKFKQAHDIDPFEDKGAAIDLKLRAEDAKRELSRRNQCTLTVSAKGKTLKVGFTRPSFEEAARGLVEKSLELCRSVRDKAGITSWKGVDALIMTGGGSRTPLVKTAVTGELGREPEKGIGVEEGVAVGALYWGIGERHRKG